MKASRDISIVEFTDRDALFNMALDYHLFCLCESGSERAFLRLYTWNPPALSLGYHEPERIIDAGAARKHGLDIVRRPTGGRVVLHRNDLTYTVVLPLADAAAASGCVASGVADIYRRVSECIVEGLRPISTDLVIDRGRTRGGIEGVRPCFASTSRYEITHRGRKVVGSAQRVGRRSVLQHGSIPVGRDYLDVGKYLRGVDPDRLREEVAAATTCLEEIAGRGVNIGEISQNLAVSFVRGLDLERSHSAADTYAEAIATLVKSLEKGEYPVTCDDNIT